MAKLPLNLFPHFSRPSAAEVVRGTLRFVLAVLFLFAAWPKLLDPGAFLTSIEGFRLVPRSVAWVAAFGIPWLEVVAAVALLIPPVERAARLLLAGLLLAFIAALLSAWARGLDVDCGCFGAAPDGSTTALPLALLRNVALLLAVAFCGRREKALTTEAQRAQRGHRTG